MLPNVTAFELSLALLDPYLTNLCATTGVEDRQDVGLPAYVRFLNPEASNHWSSLVALKSVMRSSIAFVYGVKSLGVRFLLNSFDTYPALKFELPYYCRIARNLPWRV